MEKAFTNLKSPALVSLLIVMPFMLLEWVNRRTLVDFPIVLYGLMWLLPVLLMLIAMPVVRNLRAGKSILANPISLGLRVLFVVAILFVWCAIVIDQWPCFMGVPNCD